MTNMQEQDTALLQTVNRRMAEAATEAARLKAEAEQAERIARFWSSLHDSYRRDWPCHVLALLAKEFVLIEQIKASKPEQEEALQKIGDRATAKAADLFRWFPSNLEKACEAKLTL